MTAITTGERRCALCGQASVQAVLVDAGRSGSADLDLRPPPDQRGTIAHWVQECPHCGYCAPAIDERVDGAEETVQSPAYRALRNGGDLPPLVVRLLCASTMLFHAGRLVEAAETALWAAWAADDAGATEEARRARRRTLDLLDELRSRGEHYIADEGAEGLVMVDIARRAGEFDRAERLLDGLAAVDDPRFAALVAFQRGRVAARDRARYTIAEAAGGGP
ncbi:MAG TPA: hypothetical protein PK089_01210 [Methanoregulaceae archaeon]|nr:hypothetical protein [Methanoregulaceae archaeon]HQJ87454.1 hypothetical protein [Methanoregulaceae archaeon]